MADNKKDGGGTHTTSIGPSIVIKGKLKSDEDLIVKGRIDAEITSSKALLIENTGVIKANVKVKSVRISGVVVGNISAGEKVEIAPDGRVVGDLTAPRIVINDGAAFRGRIDMFDEGKTATAPSAQSQGKTNSGAAAEPAPPATTTRSPL
jgi:cytoskeletal protein CcmA (bactofilin family)